MGPLLMTKNWMISSRDFADELAKQKRKEPVSEDSFVNPFNNPGKSPDGAPTNIFGLPGWGIIPGWL